MVGEEYGLTLGLITCFLSSCRIKASIVSF
jgi:hypothetical protein